MATKTAKPKAPTKTEKLSAYTAGANASAEGAERGSNPHSDTDQPVLFAEWNRGWDETDKVIADAEADNPGHAEPAEETNGHNFDDPDVVARQVDLAELMNAFDNVGVLIEETQWRALSDEEQGIAARWCNSRKTGVLSPVPTCLQPFASKALLDEIAPYRAEQEVVRRSLMRCKYGKPSPTKPDGDDCEEKIKMTFQVPLEEISPSRADELWGWTRIELEFGLRKANEWDQANLPGMSQIITCITEVKRYVRTHTDWQFSCFVPKDELTLVDAFDTFWKSNGSCRITPLGDATDESSRDESENPERGESDETEPAEVRQPTLFDSQRSSKHYVDEAGVFTETDDYLVPIKNDAASCVLNVGIGPDGKYYIASDLIVQIEGASEPVQIGDEWPELQPDFSHVSLQAAIESEVGWLIDESVSADVPTEIVNELRDYLRYITTGGQPQRVPQQSDSQVDPSY
ncbi:hypothetical protein [Schlesneria sp. T3-172]|uniref:hypothetical protein n=1 Tax=Schlesneria sphaerica TaxID=3373610 RepID=UPI0037C52864